MLPSIEDRGQTDSITVDAADCCTLIADHYHNRNPNYNLDSTLFSVSNGHDKTRAKSRSKVRWLKNYSENKRTDGHDWLQQLAR